MNNTEPLKYGKLTLFAEGNAITSIRINDLDLMDYILKQTPNIEISHNIFFPNNNSVIISKEYIDMYFEFLNGICLLHRDDPLLAADLASKVYAQMTIYWQSLLNESKYIKGILFWKYILKITIDWERKNKFNIHKGSLYGYIAFTYLAIGDSYAGFSYLNCALADDLYIGSVCPSLNYPDAAPSNLTISLNSSLDNFMQPFVIQVKLYLQSFMKSYQDTYKTFQVKDFDELFLENRDFINLKIYFVYCFWVIYDNINKYEFIDTDNEFNKQTNLISLFNLSLILDNVLKYYQTVNNEKFNNKIILYGDRVRKFIEISEMDSKYYSITKKFYDYKNLDISLPALLKYEPDTKKKEVNYLLISLLLRNFVAHKIDPQDVSISHFSKLIESQIYSLIMILKFYERV